MSSTQPFQERQPMQDEMDAILGRTVPSKTDMPVDNIVKSEPLIQQPFQERQPMQDEMDAILGKTATGQTTDQPVTQPVAAPSDQPTYTMDDLDTNREWIKNAKTFHQHLEGEDWKGSDKSLAEWFKRRHAQLNNDIVNMGATALSVKDMDDVTKKALVDSMDMYDDTDSDWGSFWRSLRYVATDPTTLATIPFAIATGGTATAAKIAGQRGVQVAARFALKDQIKKQLIEKGIGKEAAEEIIKTGASKEISKELIEQVVKDSAKKVALTTSGTGFAGGGAYGAAFDLADQSLDLNLGRVYDNDVYERYLEEGMSSEEARELSKVGDIDYKRLAIVTGISGLTGGAANFGMSKWAARRMSKKVGNAAVRAERLAEAEALDQLAPSTTVVISKVPKRIGDEITVASQKVEVDGDVIVDVPIEEGFGGVKAAERINKAKAANDAVKAAVKARVEAKERLNDLGIDQKNTPAFKAVMDEIDDLGVKVDKAREEYDAVLDANKAAEAAAKKRLEKARKNKLKEIRKGIKNNPNVKDTVEEVLPDGSVRFTSKKKSNSRTC